MRKGYRNICFKCGWNDGWPYYFTYNSVVGFTMKKLICKIFGHASEWKNHILHINNRQRATSFYCSRCEEWLPIEKQAKRWL